MCVMSINEYDDPQTNNNIPKNKTGHRSYFPIQVFKKTALFTTTHGIHDKQHDKNPYFFNNYISFLLQIVSDTSLRQQKKPQNFYIYSFMSIFYSLLKTTNVCFLWLLASMDDCSSIWLHDPPLPLSFPSPPLYQKAKNRFCFFTAPLRSFVPFSNTLGAPFDVLSNSSVHAFRVFSSRRHAPSSLFNPMYHWHN